MATPSKGLTSEGAEKSVANSRTGQSVRGKDESGGRSVVPPGGMEQSGAVLIFVTDLHGAVISCNQSDERNANANRFSPQDLIGRNFADLYSGGQAPSSASRALALVLEHGAFEGELRFRSKSGQDIDVRLRLTLLRDLNAAPASIVGFAVDTTREKSPAQVAGPTGAIPLARREIDGTQFLIASPLMHKFMGMVDRVAGHTETVLVTGETGTGKELVARTIHESSYRHNKALIDINCAALPEQSG